MTEPVVTDHALVRWLERVGGIDMDYFRAEIASRCEHLLGAGASGGWVDEHWVTIRNGRIVTITASKPGTRGSMR